MTLRAVASGGAGGACASVFLADQLTLSQPGGEHYVHHITTCPPSGFSNLATALLIEYVHSNFVLHAWVKMYHFGNFSTWLKLIYLDK